MTFQHLKEKDTTYKEHFRFAFGAGLVLIIAGVASLVHAVFPNILTSYAYKKTVALSRLASRGRHHTHSK